MTKLKNSIIAIVITMLFLISATTAPIMIPKVSAQSTSLPTYSLLNVAPNPCGIGQTVTLNMFLAVPLIDSEDAVNITITVTNPAGTTSTLGPFTTDTTGGTYTTYIPSATGNYTFQMYYGGQTLTGAGYVGYIEQPSSSATTTLVVTNTPATFLPNTPLPTEWWQTPVNAENVQNWAPITGPWLGLASSTFASTGMYNASGDWNPYTLAPTAAHIIWTKVWMAGGVAGGELGNSEAGSDYWTTCQYTPRYAPVIINGIEYATWYTTTTSSSQGVIAINLYTGQTEWTIDTQNPLVFGMQVNWKNPNQYGVCGPYIFTSGTLSGVADVGTEYNMYDALTGEYLGSIVNGSSPSYYAEDNNGNILAFVINNTVGTQIVHPEPGVNVQVTTNGSCLEMWNLTNAIGQSGSALRDWGISVGAVYPWSNGVEYKVQSIPTTLNGVSLVTVGLFGPAGLGQGLLAPYALSGDALVLTGGTTSVGEVPGWQVEAGFNIYSGALMWIYNRTGTFFQPYTRISNTPCAGDGIYVELNYATLDMVAYSLDTGQQVWTNSLDVKMADGNMPNAYDDFGLNAVVDQTYGVIYIWGFGGDVWAVNMTNGNILWTWSTSQLSNAGANTPYGIWPLWAFTVGCVGGGELFIGEGHEYDPPLFLGAQEVVLNITNGDLVWHNLGFYDQAPALAYGVFTTINCYDGQIYAYAQGPSATTISAPQVGATAGTPVTLTGTVMDVSAGASQAAVQANFPTGLPCVSDASMSDFMASVYEQQPMPTNITGVPVTFTVTDQNGNTYNIGTTTTNAYGSYGFNWTPQIPGNYTIVATFAGTGGYYGSCAETYLYANTLAATSAPTATTSVTGLASTNTVELGIATIAIIVIIIGAILAILMLRKRP